MASNIGKPFKTREVVMPDGKPLKVFDDIWVVHGTKTLPATVIFIDISGREAGDAPSVRALVYDAISHTLNAGIKPNPAVLNVGSGLRHISDHNNRGIRFCRDDQEELDWLMAWQAEHARTGGTGDPSQHPDPAKIPWTPWVSSGGKGGEQGGDPTGGGDVGPQDGGKETGEGGVTFHEADLNKDRRISGEEKRTYQDTTGKKVDKGSY